MLTFDGANRAQVSEAVRATFVFTLNGDTCRVIRRTRFKGYGDSGINQGRARNRTVSLRPQVGQSQFEEARAFPARNGSTVSTTTYVDDESRRRVCKTTGFRPNDEYARTAAPFQALIMSEDTGLVVSRPRSAMS